MVEFGVLDSGFLDYPLKKLDNGFVVPDASITEAHTYNQQQIPDQISFSVEAEKLGFDYVLHSENHLKLLGRNTPAPLQIQTAVAERTEQIRLLQMANILPWHDPIRLAERTSVLDIVSDGRVDVGVGTGSGPREIETFGQYWSGTADDRDQNWEAFQEKYQILLAAWTEDVMQYRGDFHDIPPADVEWEHAQEIFYLNDDTTEYDPGDYMQVNDSENAEMDAISVFPQPIQDPHPQVWKPAGSPRSAKWAARNGVNACAYCNDFSDAKDVIDAYYEAADEASWPDRRPEWDGEPFRFGWDSDRRRGVAAQIRVFNTSVASEAAFERWKLGQEFQQSYLKSNLPPEKAERRPVDAELEIREQDAPVVGDSDEIVDQLATFEDICGYEDTILVPVLGTPGMRHEERLEQLRAFAEGVMPYFAER